MEVATKLKKEISRQLSAGTSLSKSAGMQLWRQASALGLARQASANRFAYGRQSSLDPNRREPDPGGSSGSTGSHLSVPENLDSTMQLLFMASRGDTEGVCWSLTNELLESLSWWDSSNFYILIYFYTAVVVKWTCWDSHTVIPISIYVNKLVAIKTSKIFSSKKKKISSKTSKILYKACFTCYNFHFEKWGQTGLPVVLKPRQPESRYYKFLEP